MIKCLSAARAPYDAARARRETARRAREQRLAQLRAEPELLRRHLSEHRYAVLRAWLDRFGRHGQEALALLIDASAPMTEVERQALVAGAGYLGDDLLEFVRWPSAAPAVEQQTRIDRLVDLYRARQTGLLGELLERLGPLPSLRPARDELSSGALLGRSVVQSLPDRAREEAITRHAQEQLRERYRAYHDREARDQAGITGRLLRRDGVVRRTARPAPLAALRRLRRNDLPRRRRGTPRSGACGGVPVLPPPRFGAAPAQRHARGRQTSLTPADRRLRRPRRQWPEAAGTTRPRSVPRARIGTGGTCSSGDAEAPDSSTAEVSPRGV